MIDQALKAVANIVQNFQMPGAGMPNFRRNGALMAKHGIYDLRQHLDEVVWPVLRKWNIFERNDFSAEGENTREELAAFLETLAANATKFEEQRDRSFSAAGAVNPNCVSN